MRTPTTPTTPTRNKTRRKARTPVRDPLLIGAACALLVALPLTAQSGEGLHDPGPDEELTYRTGEVEWVDGPASLEPGSQVAVLEGDPGEPGVFTLRIRMPDGYRISPHWHPRPERVTVVSGTFHLGHGSAFDRDGTTPLDAGSYASMPPGSRHFAWTEGETVIQLTSTGPWQIHYVRPEDDPRERD